MKNRLIPLTLLLVISTSIIPASSQSNNIIMTINWPGEFIPSWTSNGYYFFNQDNEGSVYNVSTGQTWNLAGLVKECKNDDFIITSKNQFFCLGNSAAQDTWYQFSPENFSILSKFSIDTPHNYFGYMQNDIYITYIFGDSKPKQWNAITYNTATGQYVCNVSYEGQEYQSYIEFIGSGYLYPGDNMNGTAYYLPCTSDSLITTNIPSIGVLFDGGFPSYFQSTVFVGSGTTIKNQQTYYSQAAFIDLTGTIQLGPKYQQNAIQYNDTHFTSTYVENGFWMVGLFTVGSSLNFNLVAQLNTSIYGGDTGFIDNAGPIPGSNAEIMVTISDVFAFTYSFALGEYTSVFSDFPPFQLGNGSLVTLTAYGYFVQSPGEPIYFVRSPYTTFYVDPSFNDVWTLFMPYTNDQKYFGYDLCTVTHFQKNSSSITQFNYNSYPKSLTGAQIGDVSIDVDGNPITTIYDGYVYVINSNGFSKLMSLPAGVNVQISMNFTTGIGILVYPTTEFKISQFYINNGSVFNTSIVPMYNAEYTGYDIQKLSERYFMLATCTLTEATYNVWDSVDFVITSIQTFNLTFITLEKIEFQYRVVQFPALGVAGVNSSNILDGIAWGNTYEMYEYVGEGKPVQYYTSGQILFDLIQVEYGTYWAYTGSDNLYTWYYFNV